METAELIATVCPKIRDTGWAYYFVPETVARGQELGLDVSEFYVMGRGGVLGDVEWPVVYSAFGYFNPEIVKAAWNGGREKIEPRDAGRAYMECCHALGRQRLSSVEGLEAFVRAAEAINDAASPIGLPLYAASSSEPLADDLPARAMQLLAVLREFRGSAHLVAIVAAGLSPKEAHYLQRPEFMGMFGWPEGDVPEVTDDHRRRLEEAEALTDDLVTPAYSVLDSGAADDMAAGMAAIEAALTV